MPSSMLEQVRETALSATPWVITDRGVELYGWLIINPNAVTVYVKVFATAEPEVGTSTPLTIIPVPGGNASNPGFHLHDPERVYRCSNSGLSVAAVTGLADSDTTAPTTAIYCELVVDL